MKWFLPDPPEVSVALGSKMKALDIKEGDDVYFECSIEAYPEAERITWKKDVSFSLFSILYLVAVEVIFLDDWSVLSRNE